MKKIYEPKTTEEFCLNLGRIIDDIQEENIREYQEKMTKEGKNIDDCD